MLSVSLKEPMISCNQLRQIIPLALISLSTGVSCMQDHEREMYRESGDRGDRER